MIYSYEYSTAVYTRRDGRPPVGGRMIVLYSKAVYTRRDDPPPVGYSNIYTRKRTKDLTSRKKTSCHGYVFNPFFLLYG